MGTAPNSICFSPEGKLLAAADRASIVVWETQEWREWARLPLEPPTAIIGLPVVFSHDGQTLVAAGAHTVQFWDTSTWRPLASLACEYPTRDLMLSYSSDGRFLAMGFPDGGRPSPRTEIWDGAAQTKLDEFANRTTALRFSPTNSLLAAGDYEGILVLWDAAKRQTVAKWKAHRSAIRDVSFSPDGKVLATCGDDQLIRLWEVALPQRLLTTLSGHLSRIWVVSFSPDGRILVSGSEDGDVKFWSAHYQMESNELEQAVMPLWFSADGGILGTIDTNAVVRYWDLAARREIRSFTLPSARFSSYGKNSQIASDGKACMVRGTNGPVERWNLENHQLITALPYDEKADLRGFMFSPDHRWFAFAHIAEESTQSSEARLWNLATGQIEARFPVDSERMSFSPDGRILATVGTDFTIKLWDLTSRRELPSPGRYPNWIYCLTFSPDGKFLCVGGGELVARIWAIPSGKQVAVLAGHLGALWALAFSPDGRTLATGSTDETVKLWNVGTWQELMTLKGYGKRVSRLLFSPDGTNLAVGSNLDDNEPGPLQIWHAASLEEPAAAAAMR
jgi:WD40 repeat protein